METPPTRDEVLVAFREVLDRFDGPVFIESAPPDPIAYQRDGLWLQYLGRLKGWGVWLKKNALNIGIAICLYGDFRQGIETILSDSKIAYDSIPAIVDFGSKHLESPATGFATTLPPDNWPIRNNEPLLIAITTAPLTTTTTPSPSKTTTTTIPSGSGIVPRPSNWNYYT
jgi:hypothetical protein